MNRQKLLEAAGRVYAEGGFRGATTRRIAEEAGVNEVTLFRLFGSKAQLIAEAMQCMDPIGELSLPRNPSDPQRELAEWCDGQLRGMRRSRSLIRQTLADLEEHPEMAPPICASQSTHFQRLVDYATRVASPVTDADRENLTVACSMLFAALFSDAMGRDVVPAAYPSPEEDAADRYVRVFLRALGVGPASPSPQPVPDVRPDPASGP